MIADTIKALAREHQMHVYPGSPEIGGLDVYPSASSGTPISTAMLRLWVSLIDYKTGAVR